MAIDEIGPTSAKGIQAKLDSDRLFESLGG
jgi:hypothetical protein